MKIEKIDDRTIKFLKKGYVLKDISNSDYKSNQLKSYYINKIDFEYILKLLEYANKSKNNDIKFALFEIAVIKFFRNYSSTKSKNTLKLDIKKVVKNEEKKDDIKKLFGRFEIIRNQYIAHHELRYLDALVILGISDDKSCNKVDVVTIDCEFEDGYIESLKSLVEVSKKWVDAQISQKKSEIKNEYNKKTYDELMGLNNAIYEIPDSKDVFRNKL